VVAIFHERFENHKGTVFLMVVAMFDLLPDGSGGFRGPTVDAISRGQNGGDKKYPVDCRLIEVASSGMLLGRGSAVLDACGRRRTRRRPRRGRWGR
jgi:hypothetical protein